LHSAEESYRGLERHEGK